MKHILIIASLLFAIGLNGYAQQDTSKNQTYNFSVAECIVYAYQHQHDVKNANLDVESAGYHVKEIIGQGYPQINVTASFTDYVKSPVIVLSPTTKFPIYQPYNSSFGPNFTQIIFDPSYLVGLQGRKTYKQLYDRSYTRTKIETNVNVTKAYYQVLVSVEQLKLIEANISELKQQLDETVARNKQGFVEKIDVQRLTVQYNSLITNRENTIRLLALNYELLKFQMGMPIEKDLTLKDKLEDIQLDAGVAAAVNDTAVYRNRIEYGLLETQNKLDQYDLKLKKGQFLPKLTANGSYSPAYLSTTIGSLYNTQYPSAFIGLNLTVPIFSGWQHVNQYKESKINLMKSQNDLSDMKNTINLQVEQARISYINGLQTLNDQKKNMALAEEVLRVTKIKYEQGVGSSIEVTQAQTDVEQADNTYIQGLYDALVSKVDLDKAYGRIQ
ncbi:MAG TPA: TolC family protein [Mucilaginibacter sp.]|jgi:outer membrane protein TolC|nr:TolC family protein [Mucilaginibacter sp.]